jgi:lipid-A-disaccharide synthase
MSEAILKIRAACPELRFRAVLPDMDLLNQASRDRLPSFLEIQAGGLPEALSSSRLAIASTGTVTMECALFGVPTVAIYKTSWSTYQIARRIVKVNYLAMPNLLAGESILPEFIQESATGENIAKAAIPLLKDEDLRKSVQAALARVVANLGGPGGSRRAAEAVLALL